MKRIYIGNLNFKNNDQLITFNGKLKNTIRKNE